jgi:hypothetical protein
MKRTAFVTSILAGLLGGALIWIGCTDEEGPTSGSGPDSRNVELQAIKCDTSPLEDGDPEHEAAKLILDQMIAVIEGASPAEYAPTAINSFDKKCTSLVNKLVRGDLAAFTDQVNGLATFFIRQERSGKIENSSPGARSPDPNAPVGDYLLFLTDVLLNYGTAGTGDDVAVGVIGPDGGCMESPNSVFKMCFDPDAVGSPTLYVAQPTSCDVAITESAGPCYQVEPTGDFQDDKHACVEIQADDPDADAVATQKPIGEEEILPFCTNAPPVDSRGIQLAGGTGGLTSHSSPFYPVVRPAPTIEGTITDGSTETQPPIENASVDLFCEGDEIEETPRQTTTSNAEGFYFFDGGASEGGFEVGNTCDVHVSAEGFESNNSGDFTVESGTNTQDIQLTPVPPPPPPPPPLG